MTQFIFCGIIVFLCVLAIFDLVVGVSNDAVNFINSAIGAKAARFKTIIAVAATGVFAGAALSNGMMDVARHGIFAPQYFSFYEVICIFLAVMVTDVILLDIFNSLGMPTSTTVSLVFEMLGGALALSLVKMVREDGPGLGELLNTDKALSVIAAIFLSVAVAFITGMLVMWISRLVFTFVKPRNGSLKTILFGGVCATAIVWFLLINGLKGSVFMTPDIKEFISENTCTLLAIGFAAMTALITILAFFKVNILKTVVLMGTFALAMAFAGNDLVNFVGVPLTGLDAFLDFSANGNGDPDAFMMTSLQESAHTPVVFLLLSGAVMVLTLIRSKKAQNVVKTSVDLSRQDEGDEMFGSSSVARRLVHTSLRISAFLDSLVPAKVKAAIGKRFNQDGTALEEGAAFDMVRASVNLVLAGLLVALGTSYKLPLSTTYVTFMVAMGASLADRAWTRDSAVFRITGVLSVIGGWFITAGVAFIICFCVTNAMYFGRYFVMFLFIALSVYLLWSSQKRFAEKKKQEEDELYDRMLCSHDDEQIWSLLREHIRLGNAGHLAFVADALKRSTEGFLNEEYSLLRKLDGQIDEQLKALKRQRKREVVCMRRLDPKRFLPLNTWYFLGINSCKQMLYCMKRINDPVMEHVGNSFSPIPKEFHEAFISRRDCVIALYLKALKDLREGDFDDMDRLRKECTKLENDISDDCRIALESAQEPGINLDTLMLTVQVLQESEQLTSLLSQMLRGMIHFEPSSSF